VGRFGFIGKRLLQLVPVAVGVTIITFFLIHLIPGDPVAALLGSHYNAETARLMRADLGLDKPLPVQYGIFVGNLLHGNLGDSVYYQQSVRSLVGGQIGATIWLVVYAAVLAMLISVPLAILAALHRDGVVDQLIRAVTTFTLAMPAFWVGVMLILLLAIKVQLFPVSGYGEGILDHVYHLFLPAFTIALSFSAILIRSLRNSIIGVLQADYVDTARAKGISSWRLMRRHVLRNALLSTITIFGVNVAYLMGTTVVIEQVFAIGGIGQLLVSSILQRDYAVVQGVTLVLALCVVTINLLTDVLYAVLDPRVSYE
jgi:peptide/nickel transport system permease protein